MAWLLNYSTEQKYSRIKPTDPDRNLPIPMTSTILFILYNTEAFYQRSMLVKVDRRSPVVLFDERSNLLRLWTHISGELHQVVQLAFQLLRHRLGAVQALQNVLNNTK